MLDGFERRQVETDNEIIINCAIAGSGPPVLLLHGFPQNLAMWACVAPLLANAGFTVVCADLRGYGDSSKPRCLAHSSNYAFRVMAGDQVTLMNRLGFPQFHIVGHDRGGRTAHRMALDRPDVVLSLAVLDIVPTYAVFMQMNRHIAGAYWHWHFLSQPEPFPERIIGNDPDLFYEACLVGLGGARLEDFDAEMLADYRRCWRDAGMIHGSCSDYRAAATIDLEHDAVDLDRRIICPTLVLFGAAGIMARYFDIPTEWRKCCADVRTASLPGGHFFVDHFAEQTVNILTPFLLGKYLN